MRSYGSKRLPSVSAMAERVRSVTFPLDRSTTWCDTSSSTKPVLRLGEIHDTTKAKLRWLEELSEQSLHPAGQRAAHRTPTAG